MPQDIFPASMVTLALSKKLLDTQPSQRPRSGLGWTSGAGRRRPTRVGALWAPGRRRRPQIYHRTGGETLGSVWRSLCLGCQQRFQPLLGDGGGSDLREASVPTPACARVGQQPEVAFPPGTGWLLPAAVGGVWSSWPGALARISPTPAGRGAACSLGAGPRPAPDHSFVHSFIYSLAPWGMHSCCSHFLSQDHRPRARLSSGPWVHSVGRQTKCNDRNYTLPCGTCSGASAGRVPLTLGLGCFRHLGIDPAASWHSACFLVQRWERLLPWPARIGFKNNVFIKGEIYLSIE